MLIMDILKPLEGFSSKASEIARLAGEVHRAADDLTEEKVTAVIPNAEEFYEQLLAEFRGAQPDVDERELDMLAEGFMTGFVVSRLVEIEAVPSPPVAN